MLDTQSIWMLDIRHLLKGNVVMVLPKKVQRFVASFTKVHGQVFILKRRWNDYRVTKKKITNKKLVQEMLQVKK